MKIGEDHWLEGVTKAPLATGGSMPIRRFLVIHCTEGWADGVAVMKGRGVSAHFLIQRDGQITQCVPCNKVAYHAGQSKWRDPNTGTLYDGLNSCSIGIEFANIGDLQREKYPSTMGDLAGEPIPRVVVGGVSLEVYPEAQLAAGEELAKTLVRRYNLDDLVGHRNISPGRKSDPFSSFPMDRFRSSCGFKAPLAHL